MEYQGEKIRDRIRDTKKEEEKSDGWRKTIKRIKINMKNRLQGEKK